MNGINFKITILGILVLSLVCFEPGNTWAADGTVKVQETHQTMVGFGAAVAWYNNWLTNHPNENSIYYQIFDDLGLDILRLRNSYRGNPAGFAADDAEIVGNMYTYTTTDPKILLSSWSPSADLKSNNSVNSGTLKKVDGNYVYGDFARWWVESLDAYYDAGIVPDYISMQNEPSYDASWESCYFNPAENATWPGYNRALDSVYTALQQMALIPQILAAEAHGIGYNTFQNYANQFNHDYVDGYAYHLYHGGSANNTDPDQFISNLSAIATNYNDKPIFQTEYDYGDWFNTAWLMHNCLVHGNVSGYLYWGLIWDAAGGKPLIGLENPWDQGGWTTADGFVLNPEYWAFRQYSRYIDIGWKRVTAASSDANLKISGFVSPDGTMLTLVLLNISATVAGEMNFNIEGFAVSNGIVVHTSDEDQGVEVNSNYNGSTAIELPPRSITTIVFNGNLVDAIEAETVIPVELSLAQNFPNPFNPTTTIEYSLVVDSYVQMKVFTISGQHIATLVNKKMPAGRHTVNFDASGLVTGVYVYQIQAGEFRASRKMVLIK